MLVIRLARTGRTKYPTYRIVAAESSRAATGKFVEILGHYNPHTKELAIKKERVLERLSHGAQPSNTVAKLLQSEKVELPGWVAIKTRDRKPKKEPVEAEAAAPAAETPEAQAEAEAPTDEQPQAEERVAEAATDNAAEVEAKNEADEKTETAEDTEAAAEAAEKTDDAGAQAADDAAKEASADKSDDTAEAKTDA